VRRSATRTGRIASEAYVAIVERQRAISDWLGEAIAPNAGKGENHFSAFVWPDTQRHRQASAFVPSDATCGCNMVGFMHARARARIDALLCRAARRASQPNGRGRPDGNCGFPVQRTAGIRRRRRCGMITAFAFVAAWHAGKGEKRISRGRWHFVSVRIRRDFPRTRKIVVSSRFRIAGEPVISAKEIARSHEREAHVNGNGNSWRMEQW